MTRAGLHCRRRSANKPRGLCTPCYRNPGVRAGHPHLGPGGRHGLPCPPPERRLPLPVPTDAPPGTEKKLLAMIGRAERGEALWHPRDFDGGDPTHGPLRAGRWLASDRSPW